jgi:hypothetical protein
LPLISARMLPWRGSKGANISVGFDDDLFGEEAMQAEIAFMSEAPPNLPDEVPQGTSFAFAKDSTGGLFARFRVAIPSIGTRTRAACTNCGRVCTTSIVSCTHGTTRRRLRSARSVTVVPYSPECVEEEFCELRLFGILRTSQV